MYSNQGQQQPPQFLRVSAFDVFIDRCRLQFQNLSQNGSAEMNWHEYQEYCAKHWNSLSVQERYEYQRLADEDFARKNNNTVSVPVIPKPKKKKDPNAPKRPTTGFFYFSNDHRNKVREENPEARGADVCKILGKMWQEATAEVRQKYNEMYVADKARYEKEKAEYMKKLELDKANGNGQGQQ